MDLSLIKKIIEEDPALRSVIAKKIQDEMDSARARITLGQLELDKASKALDFLSNDGIIEPVQEEKWVKGATRGTKNHNENIVSVIRSNPGIKVGPLREILNSNGAEIKPKVLNSILSELKRKNIIKTEGRPFHHEYFLV